MRCDLPIHPVTMKKRLFFGAGGAVLGVSVSAPLQDTLHWSPTLSIAVCFVVGLVFGFMASAVWDAFTTTSEEL